MRAQAGRMLGFLVVLLLATGVVGAAFWFYRGRVAADNGAGAIVLLVMVLALLIVVLVGAAKLAGERP